VEEEKEASPHMHWLLRSLVTHPLVEKDLEILQVCFLEEVEEEKKSLLL
jgi:hypothetical protein